jgi:predicted DNA-binding transcriptional regulator YafY
VEGVKMQRNKPQSVRLIELDRLIRAGKYPNCRSFGEKWEVSQKTIQRDFEYLRDSLGAPLAYDYDQRGYYYTHLNWFLPAISLTEAEICAALIGAKALRQYSGTGLGQGLDEVIGKITAALPNKLTLVPEIANQRFSFMGTPAKTVSENIWKTVVHGLMYQRSLQITYRAMESTSDKARRIDPYHIANLQGEWYVLAWDHRAGAISQMSIARIRTAEIAEESFEVPSDFDPEKYLKTAFGRFLLGDKVEQVVLRFDKAVAPWVQERQWHPQQKIRKLSNGDLELTFPAASLFEVHRWVLAWGHWVKVVEPKELKKMVEDEVRLMVCAEVEAIVHTPWDRKTTYEDGLCHCEIDRLCDWIRDQFICRLFWSVWIDQVLFYILVEGKGAVAAEPQLYEAFRENFRFPKFHPHSSSRHESPSSLFRTEGNNHGASCHPSLMNAAKDEVWGSVAQWLDTDGHQLVKEAVETEFVRDMHLRFPLDVRRIVEICLSDSLPKSQGNR